MAFRFSDSEIHMSKAGLACVLDQINIIHVTAYVVATARQLAKDHGLCGYDPVHIARAVVVGCDVLTRANAAVSAAALAEGIHVADTRDIAPITANGPRQEDQRRALPGPRAAPGQDRFDRWVTGRSVSMVASIPGIEAPTLSQTKHDLKAIIYGPHQHRWNPADLFFRPGTADGFQPQRDSHGGFWQAGNLRR